MSVGSNNSNRKIRQLMGTSQSSPVVNTTTTTQADCNIFPAPQNQIQNISNYIYDEQTILYLNSGSQNYTTGTYFNNTQVDSSWNYSVNNSNNLLAGQTALMNLYGNNLQSYQNFNTFGGLPQASYNIDFTNGNSSNGLFFAVGGSYTNSTSSGWNTVPSYSNTGTSSYLLVGNYMFQTQQDILTINVSIVINGTDALYTGNTGNPRLSAKVVNIVNSQSSLANGGTSGAKYYEQIVPLKYSSNTEFDNTVTTQYLHNSVPLVFAPNFIPVCADMSLLYIPPVNGFGQYLPGVPGTVTNGYPFVSGQNNFDTSTFVQTSQPSDAGYFVIGMAYTYGNSYSPYLVSGIQEEVVTTNIWRSPISLYNSYKNYSVLDASGLQVTLLFGKTANGGLFLVTNTGTPISSITAYGFTPLTNFINIMQAFFAEYNNTSSLVNYFIDPFTIAQNKMKGYNVSLVQLQAVIDSLNKIKNPSSIETLPNINYFIVHQNNSSNISIDPSLQNVINQTTGQNYFGLTNTALYALGDNFYANSRLDILSTSNHTLFGNSIFIGTQTINNAVYYISMVLPESSFRPNYSSVSADTLNIYATHDTSYYVNNTSGSTRFVPGSIQTNTTNQPKYDISKLQLTVSNNIIS